MKIKEVPLYERPREKFLLNGPSSLSDAELLAILLKTGTKDINVLNLAFYLLNEINGIKNLTQVCLTDLEKIKGIGKTKAIEILAAVELSKRIFYQKNTEKKVLCNNPKSIFDNTRYLFSDLLQEYFYCLYLDNKKNLLMAKLLFKGTLNKSIVHPREIFKEAYKSSAASIVCIHNHPSGDITPSLEDIKLTESLVQIGKLNGIPLVDHLIVSENKYYSFYESGLIK